MHTGERKGEKNRRRDTARNSARSIPMEFEHVGQASKKMDDRSFRKIRPEESEEPVSSKDVSPVPFRFTWWCKKTQKTQGEIFRPPTGEHRRGRHQKNWENQSTKGQGMLATKQSNRDQKKKLFYRKQEQRKSTADFRLVRSPENDMVAM